MYLRKEFAVYITVETVHVVWLIVKQQPDITEMSDSYGLLMNFMPEVKEFSKTKEFLECVGHVLFLPSSLIKMHFSIKVISNAKL